MAKYCNYCGLSLSDEDTFCPNCGAPAPEETAPQPESSNARSGLPRSLEELKSYCRTRRIAPEKLGFSIGEDSSEPRTTGIFRESDGCFVVYRNRSDGTRFERYRGPDEELAVRQFAQRLQDEYERRKAAATYRAPARSAEPVRRGKGCFSRSLLIVIVLIILFSLVFTVFDKRPSKGYYRFNEIYYYYESGDWYYYSEAMQGWIPAGGLDPELKNNARDYFQSSVYRDSFPVPDFLAPASYIPPDEINTENVGVSG